MASPGQDSDLPVETASCSRYSRMSPKDDENPFGAKSAVSSDLLKTAILSGSTDMYGNPLVIFPKDRSDSKSRTTCKKEDLTRLLLLYNDVTKILFRRKRLAFLSEMRSDTCNVSQLLNELECRRPGSVAVLYLLRQKSDSTAKKLKKMLGMKNTKKKSVTFVQLYKTVKLNCLPELYTQIDSSQLTVEFGGNILYNHEAWTSFFQDILPSIWNYEEMLRKLEGLKDRSFLLQEYDTRGHSSQHLKGLRQEIENNFKVILSDSGIINCLEHCKKLLHNLDQPSDDTAFRQIYKSFYLEVSSYVRNVFLRLTSTKKTVCSIWAAVDEEIETDIEIKQRAEDTENLCMKISETFWPLLSQHPSIGSSLTEVKKIRNQFTHGLYNPAKEIINEATDILEMVKGLQPLEERHSLTVQKLAIRLKKTVDPFAKQLGELNKIYTSVHIFYLVFQNCLQWYKKALHFVPRSLCTHASRAAHNTLSIPCPGWWFQMVHDFLQKHPAPKENQISLLDIEVPAALDQFVKTQAVMLSNRVRILVDILMSSHIETMSLCNVLMWKKEEENGSEPFVSAESQKNNTQEQIGSLFHKKSSTPTARIKRRISRSKTMRSEISARMYRSLPRIDRGMKSLRKHQISRSSSTDTELKDNDFDETGFRDLYESERKGSYPNTDLDTQSVKSMPSLCDHIGQAGNQNEELVGEIQRVTSAKFIDNNTKLRYVSDLISGLKMDNSSIKSTSLNKRCTQRNKNAEGRQKKGETPAQRIAALNSRLSRSLDNLLHFTENESAESGVNRDSKDRISRQQSSDIGILESFGARSSVDSSDNIHFLVNTETSNSDKDESDSCSASNKDTNAYDAVEASINSLDGILEFERQEYRKRKVYHPDVVQPTLKGSINEFSDEPVFDVSVLSSNSFEMTKPSRSYDESKQLSVTSSLHSWSSDLGYDSQAERTVRMSEMGPINVNDLKNEWRV